MDAAVAHATAPPSSTSPPGGPAPTAPREAAPSDADFDVRRESKRYDFHIVIHGGCPGLDGTGMGCRGPASIAIRRKDGPLLGTIELESLWIRLGANGTAEPDLTGDEAWMGVADFDFDGRDDFAFRIGAGGPDGGPSFAIVRTTAAGALARASELEAVQATAQELMRADPRRKLLITISRSGCCTEKTEEHALRSGAWELVRRITVVDEPPASNVIEEKLEAGRWVTSKRTLRRRAPY